MLMRRCIVSICLVLGTMVCSAREVTQKVAESVAQAFFASNPVTKASASSLKLLWDGVELGPSTKSYSMVPPFYVYGLEDREGFVIVSGDDICIPVLGFSYEHSFNPDDIPAGMRDWLEMSRTAINEGRRQSLSSTPAVSSAWKTATKASDFTPIKQLETAEWNQTAPYNWKSPILDPLQGHTYTGCTNTATAIVMKYWEYPSAGKGTLEGYDYISYDGGPKRHMDGHALGHKYAWDKMLMSYDDGYSESEGNAVATLMYDLGVMNRCHWGNLGSSSSYHVPEYIKYMGYDPSTRQVYISDYNNDFEIWYYLLKKEIDEGRPVLYDGGQPVGDGHAFVLDGYAADDYFSFNWGWGGYSNGYFSIDPSRGNQDLITYWTRQSAILGMKPDDGVDECIEDAVLRISSLSSDLANALYHGNSSYSIDVRVYASQAEYLKVSNTLCPALMNNGKVVKYLSEGVTCTLQGGSSSSLKFECEVPTGLKRDDYIAIGRIDSDGKWRKYSNMSTFSLSEGKPLAEGLELVLSDSYPLVVNNSMCSYVEITQHNASYFLHPRNDRYLSPGRDYKVVIYDCFDSYEMTIKM